MVREGKCLSQVVELLLHNKYSACPMMLRLSCDLPDMDIQFKILRTHDNRAVKITICSVKTPSVIEFQSWIRTGRG